MTEDQPEPKRPTSVETARIIAPIADTLTHDRLLLLCKMKRRYLLHGEMDFWTAVTGPEGSGKSTIAITAACYTDPSFIKHWRERIAYTAPQFTSMAERLVDQRKPGKAIVLDEAAEAWFSQDWASQIQKALTKLSVQIRYAALDVYLCSPTLKLLGAGAVRRCTYWIDCELKPGFVRGYCTVYQAVRSPFSKYRTPYMAQQFWHRFDPLPEWLYVKYKAFKISEARKRLADYTAIASGRAPSRPAPEEAPARPAFDKEVARVVETVLGRADILANLNNRKTVSPEVLLNFFPSLGRDRSRAASKLLGERIRAGEAELDGVRHETVVRKGAGES